MQARCGEKWHWSSDARERCLDHQADELAEQATVDLARLNPSWEEMELQREREAHAALVAAHHPKPASDANHDAMISNGHRQLAELTPRELEVVGLLTSAGIYPINRDLRSGFVSESGPPAANDFAGFSSCRQFVDAALDLFERTANETRFDQRIRLYRGIRVTRELDDQFQDIAGIGGHLTHGTAWAERFVEAGFSFATTNAWDATMFGRQSPEGHLRPSISVLFELDAGKGLCLPSATYRSTDLFSRCVGRSYIDNAMDQVIFPPGSTWEILGITLNTEYGVPVVKARQN